MGGGGYVIDVILVKTEKKLFSVKILKVHSIKQVQDLQQNNLFDKNSY